MCIQNISLQNETSEVRHIRPLIFVTSFRWFRSQPWGFHLDFMMVASMFEWPQRKMWKMWMWHRTSKYKTWWTWMDDKWNCMVSHEFMVVNHDSNTCGFLFGGPCSWSCDLQPSKRRSSCCGGKSSSPPPPNCFNAIHTTNLLEIPEAWIFVEISVDPQNYRSFPHIFLGREMLTWRCKMPTRSNRCLGMWSQNLFDFIHMFLSKNAAHYRSQGLLMAPRIW